jgi:hypothetical protein
VFVGFRLKRVSDKIDYTYTATKLNQHMKKELFLTTVVSLILLSANAQLAGTKWQGTIKIPMDNGVMQPFQSTWYFQNDTLTVVYEGGKLLPDVMAYTEDKNIVTVHKISGGVPCDNTAAGKISYSIKNDQLFITRISDACPARGSADLSQPLDKLK